MADLVPTASVAVEADRAKEPIHIPGGIQPHGFLFSIAADGIVLQASANGSLLSGAPAEDAPGQPLQRFLGAEWATNIVNALNAHSLKGISLYVGSFDVAFADDDSYFLPPGRAAVRFNR
jgi:light-regulated signal transduction histidine kinase (bacteriophytochrome)